VAAVIEAEVGAAADSVAEVLAVALAVLAVAAPAVVEQEVAGERYATS
jgi:hypothetical protein